MTYKPAPEGFVAVARAYGLPDPVAEVRFHESRKWRLDYGWLAAKVAIEVEGGVFVGGRHTRGKGFVNDIEKYAEAMCLGWKVLRVTPDMLKDGRAFEWVRRLLGAA